MRPTSFPGYTNLYGKPPTWPDEDCGTLECVQGMETLPGGTVTSVIKSRWLPSPEEIILMLQGHPVTLNICCSVMVPASLYVDPESHVTIFPPAFDQTMGDLVRHFHGDLKAPELAKVFLNLAIRYKSDIIQGMQVVPGSKQDVPCGMRHVDTRGEFLYTPDAINEPEVMTGNGEGRALPLATAAPENDNSHGLITGWDIN